MPRSFLLFLLLHTAAVSTACGRLCFCLLRGRQCWPVCVCLPCEQLCAQKYRSGRKHCTRYTKKMSVLCISRPSGSNNSAHSTVGCPLQYHPVRTSSPWSHLCPPWSYFFLQAVLLQQLSDTWAVIPIRNNLVASPLTWHFLPNSFQPDGFEVGAPLL